MRHAPSPFHSDARRGFTMLEMLIVVAIIGALVGLLLPAVQSAREAARRTSCASQLTQIGMAIQAYHSAFDVLPAGTVSEVLPVEHYPNGYHHSWIVRILPMLDLQPLAKQVDWTHSVYDPANWPVAVTQVPHLQCPSTYVLNEIPVAVTSYAGVFDGRVVPLTDDSRGLLIANRFLSREDVPDGFAYTLLAGEKTLRGNSETDFGWMSGTRSTLRTTGYVPRHDMPAEEESLYSWGETPLETVWEPYGRYRGDADYDPATDRDPAVEDETQSDIGDGFLKGMEGGVEDWDMEGGFYAEEDGEEWEEPLMPVFPAPPAPDQRTTPGRFDSRHEGGLNMLWGDGRVAFVSSLVDAEVFSQMGVRDDALPLERQPIIP